MSLKALRPTYYKDFSCSGGDCKYNCCHGWRISFNKNDYDRVKKAKKTKEMEQLINRVYKRDKKSMDDRQYGNFVLGETSQCLLLTEKGLCQLQLECGYDSLCDTCKKFPRMYSQINSGFEIGFSLGCEEVVKLLLKQKDGVAFENVDFTMKINMAVTININKDVLEKKPIANYYYDIKTLGIAILQAQNYSLDDRMIILGIAFQQIKKFQEENQLEQIPAYVDSMMNNIGQSGLTDAFNDMQANPMIAMNEIALLLIDGRYLAHSTLFSGKVIDNLGITIKKVGEKDVSLLHKPGAYEQAKARLDKFLLDYPRALENIMVNEFHWHSMPFGHKDYDIWSSYVKFINLYNLVKMSAAGYLDDEIKLDDFVYVITCVGRMYSHGEALRSQIFSELNKNESSSLAHMVMLIKS